MHPGWFAGKAFVLHETSKQRSFSALASRTSSIIACGAHGSDASYLSQRRTAGRQCEIKRRSLVGKTDLGYNMRSLPCGELFASPGKLANCFASSRVTIY
ncbi:MAG: hypothetical protein DME99_01095 [Verrucomicrobia bacterium]|nr:MAG: hypothetical protein DME99_01095 [Verrucomicrobiota bacterium]